MVSKLHLLVVPFIVLFAMVSGCADIGNDIDELESSISQAKEDLRFLEWAADSTGTILDDYDNIKNATSEIDNILLQESGKALKEDSENALSELDSFSVSPSLQEMIPEFRDFLTRSYEFGEFVETNSQTIDFEALEKTIKFINETSALLEDVSELAAENS